MDLFLDGLLAGAILTTMLFGVIHELLPCETPTRAKGEK